MLPFIVVCFLSEFLGTATFVLLSCLGCMFSAKSSTLPLLQSSLVYGASYTGMLHCFAISSGAHANPSITIAAYIMGRVTMPQAIVYGLSQLGGAFASGFLLIKVLGQNIANLDSGLCTITPMNGMSLQNVFLVELVLTSLLIMAWCTIWSQRYANVTSAMPIRMGLFMMVFCLAGGQLTGANLNPAKALALAYHKNTYDYLNVYVSAQLVAAIAVPIVWNYIFRPVIKRRV